MKKEEFLAMSLPFGLKMQSNMNKKDIVNVYGIELNEGLFHADTDEYSWYCINMFKPILHPLSDLTKTIEHNGEKFVPLHKLLEMSNFKLSRMSINQINDYECVYNNIDIISFKDAMYLVSIHFDIFDLISKGEAIDVNTLEINPYK